MTTLYSPTHALLVALRQRWPTPQWLTAYWASRWAHDRWFRRHP